MKGIKHFSRRVTQPGASWIVWAAPVILFAPLWLAGKALYWGTPSLQFAPWRWIAGQMLQNMELPLWNPWSGMGSPLLANYQSALLYPPNWLLLIFQLVGDWVSGGSGQGSANLGLGMAAWAQTPLVILHLVWASWGMARLAGRMGMNPLARNVSALSFGLGGYLVARAGFLSINAAAAWMPWSILAAEWIARPEQDDNQSRRWINVSLIFAMLLLAGHAQTAWYILLLTAIWVVVRTPANAHRRKEGRFRGITLVFASLPGIARAGLVLITCIVFAILLSAAQLFPTAEYLLQSQRAAQVDYKLAMTYSFWPWHFITLLAPGFFGSPVSGDYWGYANIWEDAVYIGLLPLLLAVSAVLRLFRKAHDEPLAHGEGARALVKFLGFIVLISFLLAMGENTPVFPWLYRHVPTFDMFQAPARFGLWAVFGLSLLAGVGAHQWRRPVGSGVYWLRLGTMGAVAVMVGAGLGWILLGEVSPTFVRAAALTGLWGTAAGILGLRAPVGTRMLEMKAQEPFLRRVLRGISPSLVRSDALQRKASKQLLHMPSWLRPATAQLSGVFEKRWEAIVILVIAVDLIVAGFGLNPGVELDFYTEHPRVVPELKNLASTGRLYLPAEDERRLKFDIFLRFDTFTPDVEWNSMREVLLPNLNLFYGVPSVNNFDPLVPGRYDRWMQSLDEAPLDQRQVMLNLMGVSVVENMVNTPNALVEFQNQPSAARWRWLPCARFADNEDDAWQQVMGAGDKLLDEYVVVEGYQAAEVVDEQCTAVGHVPVQITRLSESANLVALRINSPSPGWLMVADTWYPGWRAYLDNIETLMPVGDYLFRAVWVPAGEHEVTLKYTPASFRVGAVISLLAWLSVLAMINRKFRWGQP